MTYQTFPLFASYVSAMVLTEDTSSLKDHTEDMVSTYGTSLISSNNRVLEKYPKIKKILLNKFKKIAKDEYEYDNDFIITTSWFTKTEKDQESKLHSHKNSFYSGVYYFGDYSEDSAPIQFETPLLPFSDFYIEPQKWNIKNSQIWKINLQKNLLILFPSYLRHTITKSKDDVVRDSLAFNIVPIGEYRANDSTYNTGWLT